MNHTDRLEVLRQQIAHTEEVNAERRRREALGKRQAEKDPVSEEDDGGSPLPPRVPRPEYAVTPDLISVDDAYLGFYIACEEGRLLAVQDFIRETDPSQATRQFGLEQASFGGQPEVIGFLLGSTTILHTNAFIRSIPTPGSTDLKNRKDICILDEDREQNPLEIIRVFLEHGWHPNQAWSYTTQEWPTFPLTYRAALTNRPLLTLLLSHGADPNLGRTLVTRNFEERALPADRRSGGVLNMAARLFDVAAIDLLLDHGAKPDYAHMLHSIAEWQGAGPKPAVPWPQRRVLAEHLVSRQIADVNEVRRYNPRSLIGHAMTYAEDLTPFSEACAAQDWEFAEWLLERGADPDAVDGKALKKQWYMEPYLGPNNPDEVRKLVDSFRQRET